MLFFLAVSCAETVPPLSMLGKWHQVKNGDTVEKVASRYGIDKEELAELNQVSESGMITGREQIFIPLRKGNPPGDGKPPKKARREVAQADTKSSSKPAAPTAAKPNRKSECGRDLRDCYMWPADGSVARWFGAEGGDAQSDGIDIVAPRGTDVVAVADGEVLYSGNAIKGYGNLLLVRHDGDVISVYAHNERNIVAEGKKVRRGEKIAEVGDSGAAAEPLLHFEIRVNEQPVNPMLYLEEKE